MNNTTTTTTNESAPVYAPHASMSDAVDALTAQAQGAKSSKSKSKSKSAAKSSKLDSAPVKRVKIDCDALGARKKISRARAINDVLMSAETALSVSEIEKRARASRMGREYAKINGREIGAVAAHLAHLLLNECVGHVGGAWRVVSKLRRANKSASAPATDAPAAQ